MHTNRMPRRRAAVAVAAAVAAMGVAGCGDSGSAEPKAEATAGSSATEVSDAQKRIEQAKEPLTFKAPGPDIDASKLKGKGVVVVAVDMRIPAIALTAKAAKEAAGVVGMSARLIDAASDPSKMLQGVQQGVQTAQGIVIVGVSQPLVSEPLKKAKAADIPVVSAIVSEPLPNEPGQGAGPDLFANSSQSNTEAGELMAAKAIVDTKGRANVAIFTTKEITANRFVVQGIKNVLGRCGSCKIVTEEDTPLAQWSTGLTTKVESVLRRSADINYVLPIFDAMALFIAPGVEATGKAGEVKVASFNGTPAALKLVQQGGTLTADPGQPNGWAGWLAVDQTMRGMLGLEPGDPEVPIRYFDQQNLSGVDVGDEEAVYGQPGYREGFKRTWGLD
ncbi:MAG: monosaccharide transporter substrate-binding protein family [Solirubrobacterales bacterium]|jgi:ribose transport system substrate-binding protein|nr:monosaccharide transporter substrate-binding protein family [Solirubrobacterales bacterium]